MTEASSLNFDNEVFQAFAFYTVICVLKMLAMGLLTTIQRISRGVYSSQEDAQFFLRGSDKSKKKPIVNDGPTERARRNHQNDMEVIVPFALVGFFFCLDVNVPSAFVAINHFRVFTAMRFIHTLCFQFALQPFRTLSHIVSILVILHMSVHILIATKGSC